MIDHEPWAGSAYRPGWLMLWGFSHHRFTGEPDAPDFTISTIKEWAFTEQGQFFRALRTVCGGTDPVALKVTGGEAPLTVFVNGIPLAGTAQGRAFFFTPEGPGFVRLTVMDARGKADSVTVRLQ